jgi:hypothetical protein
MIMNPPSPSELPAIIEENWRFLRVKTEESGIPLDKAKAVFELLARYAPYLAADRYMAESFVWNQSRIASYVPLEMIRVLCETQRAIQDGIVSFEGHRQWQRWQDRLHKENVTTIKGETILSGAPSHKDDYHVSEFTVMESTAGYYIGTFYTHCDWTKTACKSCEDAGLRAGSQEPNSRETDYFDKIEEAKQALATYRLTGTLPRMRT